MKLTVILGTAGEAEFDIELYQNNFVQKWTEELQWCLDNSLIDQQESFLGLQTLHEANQNLINACVVINRYLKKFIEIRPDLETHSQEYFNYLHSKFEQLSGEFGKPTRLFSIASDELKQAIRELNYYTHRLEKQQDQLQRFTVRFDKNHYRRIPLTDTDYDFCQFALDPGILFVHYAELGKDFYDIFKDGLDINYQGLKNLHYYSGDITAFFYRYDPLNNSDYVKFLKQGNIDPYNKKLGHGKIPLGAILDLKNSFSKIQKYRYIKNILIKE